MSFLKKALERGLTLPNVSSYLSLEIMRRWGACTGTLRLRLKAALLGVQLGRGVTAHGPVALMRWPGSRIVIGDNVHFISSWRRASAAALAHPVRLRVFGSKASISLGDGCELSGSSITCRSTSVTLGRKVLLAPNVIIVDSDFHAPWPAEARQSEPGIERDRPVVIGDYAWIGMNSIILKGVTIGRGAIIGAGSVVTRDIPANAVACGAPARVVRIVSEDMVAQERTGRNTDSTPAAQDIQDRENA